MEVWRAKARRANYSDAEMALMILEELEGDAYAIVFPYDISYFDCH